MQIMLCVRHISDITQFYYFTTTAANVMASIQHKCYCVSNNIHGQNKYQLSLTNPRDMLHHGKHAADKGECSL